MIHLPYFPSSHFTASFAQGKKNARKYGQSITNIIMIVRLGFPAAILYAMRFLRPKRQYLVMPRHYADAVNNHLHIALNHVGNQTCCCAKVNPLCTKYGDYPAL
jgi:hypothetical protein